MDVVPPGKIRWQYDPFSADEVDRKIYGRDAADMKGGLIALVFAMLELKDAGVELNEDVKLLGTAGEETRAVGSGRLYQDGYMDGVGNTARGKPTTGDIMIANKGVSWVEITCYGRTVHGSMPETGINAIAHMNQLLNAPRPSG